MTAETNSIEDINLLIEKYNKTPNKKEKKHYKELIILTCMPIVKSIAYSFARRSTDPVDDIIQIGSIGLIKAIDAYKQIEGKNFKSYAKVLITGEIKHYLRDCSELIRSSRAMKELSYKIKKMTLELTEKLGHNPSDEELANALQVPQEKITECITQDRRITVISIDNNNESSEDSTFSLIERIEDEGVKRNILFYENRTLLDEIISQLPSLEQDILTSYYYDELTYTDISLRYNISNAKVTSMLKHALEFIINAIAEKGINNLYE